MLGISLPRATTSATPTAPPPVTNRIRQLVAQLGDIIVGKEETLRLAVVCLLAKGHLLIEDIPGVGKTTLSQALARSIGLQFRRIQFTSDLLPADIIGNSIFDREHGRFVFHPGPIFSSVLLIDEVNRATPKTQSALPRSDGGISSDRRRGDPVAAAAVLRHRHPKSSPANRHFSLPESQLDRFLMRLELGFPNRAANGKC